MKQQAGVPPQDRGEYFGFFYRFFVVRLTKLSPASNPPGPREDAVRLIPVLEQTIVGISVD